MKPYRSTKYIKWIKDDFCIQCGCCAKDPHHIIGHGQGGMSATASDLFAVPMCRTHHMLLHHDRVVWEEEHGNQWCYVVSTLKRAIDLGVIDKDLVISEIYSQVLNQDDKEFLLNQLKGV